MINEKNPEFEAHRELVATAKSEDNTSKANSVKTQVMNTLRFRKTPTITASKIMDALDVLVAKYPEILTNQKNVDMFFNMINANATEQLASQLEKAVISKSGKSVNEHKLSKLLEEAVKAAFR